MAVLENIAFNVKHFGTGSQ